MDSELAMIRLSIQIVRQMVGFFAALSLVLIGTPIVTPFLAHAEAKLFPVVTEFRVLEAKQHYNDTYVYVSFNKVRNCEFLGVNWYVGPDRLPIEFLEDAGNVSISRPKGDQVTGPWRVGIKSLEGTNMSVQHRCHGLWLTETHLYP